MKKTVLASLLVLMFAAANLQAQLLVTADVGQQKVTYGSSYDTSYKGAKTTSAYMDAGLGFIVGGHSQRKYGANLLIAGDLQFPFNNDINTGGISSFGGVAQVNARLRSLSVGTGLDIHYYLFPEDSSTNRRPDETLFSVPVVAKYNFGPAGRAFVQGGGAFIVANSASLTDSLGNSYTSNTVNLGKSHTSGEIRIGAGYMFGRWGVRANYLKRDAYFDASNHSSYYDFHQTQFSGGILLTAF